MERKGNGSPRGGDRAGKRAGRRARGLEIQDRGGYWYVTGTVRAGGRSIRVRRSLGLPATSATWDDAWAEARLIEGDIAAEARGEASRGDPVAIAARAYLTLTRVRPLGATAISIVQEIVARFGPRRLNEIPDSEWKTWVDTRQTGNAADTRERFINGVVAFQHYAVKHHKMNAVVEFSRDKQARNPRRRKRRRVSDLRPELIALLLEEAHITLRAQLAAEWSTGARVSSVLYGVRICDVILAPGRETIIFRNTKNGEDVAAALHPSAAAILRDYAAWRGNMRDREQPFFLTYKRQPYVDNGKAGGGQNKTGFNAAKRRARLRILEKAFLDARQQRRLGNRAAALDILLAARDDARLMRKLTQHWFRHLLATRMRHDLRAAMEQGGWLDERSILGYVHDVPDARRATVAAFDDFGTIVTHDEREASAKR
jgi:hypothetical protein